MAYINIVFASDIKERIYQFLTNLSNSREFIEISSRRGKINRNENRKRNGIKFANDTLSTRDNQKNYRLRESATIRNVPVETELLSRVCIIQSRGCSSEASLTNASVHWNVRFETDFVKRARESFTGSDVRDTSCLLRMLNADCRSHLETPLSLKA